MPWYPHAIKLLHHIKNALVTPSYQIAPKMCDFQRSHKMHSRGPTEQHFYVWEPRCGYLHKAKKVRWYPLIKEGQRSHKYAFWGVNVAIKMKIALVPPCSMLLRARHLSVYNFALIGHISKINTSVNSHTLGYPLIYKFL